MNTTPDDKTKSTEYKAGFGAGSFGDASSISNKDSFKEEAPQNFWSKEGLEKFDHKIFEDKEFEHTEWAKNKSIANAARELFKMKEGTDPEDLAELNSMSDEELCDYALNKMRWFNNNIYSTGKLALQIHGATDEQKIATLFLMDAYEHMDTEWTASNIGNFLYQGVLTDPSTIGSLIIGAFTFGAGGVATKTAAMAGTEATKRGAIYLMRKAAQKLVTENLDKLVNKGVQETVKKGYKKAMTGYSGAIIKGSVPGIIEGVGFDQVDQRLRKSELTYNGKDFQRQQGWNDGKTLMTIGMGGLMGVAFGAGGYSFARGDLKKAYKWASKNISESRARMKSNIAKIKNDPNIHGNAVFGGGKKKNKQSGQTFKNSGVKVRLKKTLPQMKRGIDWRKTLLRRNFQLSKLFTNWESLRNMRMRSKPVTRPVTRYIDKLFAGIADTETASKSFVKIDLFSNLKFFKPKAISKKSPLKIIQNLQESILEKLETGQPSNKTIEELINDVAQDAEVKKALKSFSREMDRLYKHVEKTYKTVDEIDSVPEGLDFIRAGKYGRHGLEVDQKNVLLAKIKEMQEIADDLQLGTLGENGKRMLEISADVSAGNRSVADIRDDLGGLSKANSIADQSYTRLTSEWAGSDKPNFVGKKKANWEWIDKLSRQIDDGEPHNGHHQINIRRSNLMKQNAEAVWQNDFDSLYKSIGKISDNGVYSEIKWDVVSKKQFAGFLKRLYNLGLGNEAFYIVKRLAFLRHGKGGTDQPMLPSDIFDGISNLPKDKAFTTWAEDLQKYVDELEVKRAGAQPEGNYFKRNFGYNRINIHSFTSRDYPTEFGERYRGTNWLATPGKNFFYKWAKYKAQTSLYWISGAHTSKIDLLPGTGSVRKNVTWRGLDKEGNPKKATFGTGVGVFRRSATRILTGGLVNDIGGPVIKGVRGRFIPIPSRLGWTALSGAGMYGIGYGVNEWADYLKGSESGWVQASGYALNVPGHSMETFGATLANLSTYPFRKEWEYILGHDDPISIPFPEHEPEAEDLSKRIVQAAFSLDAGFKDPTYLNNKTSDTAKAEKYETEILSQLALKAETALTDAEKEIKQELDIIDAGTKKIRNAQSILDNPNTDKNIKLTHDEYLRLQADLRNTSDSGLKSAKQKAVDAAENAWNNAKNMKSQAEQDIIDAGDSIRRAKNRLSDIAESIRPVREYVWSILDNIKSNGSVLNSVSYDALITGTPSLRAVVARDAQNDLNIAIYPNKQPTVQEKSALLFKSAREKVAAGKIADLSDGETEVYYTTLNSILERVKNGETLSAAEIAMLEEARDALKKIDAAAIGDDQKVLLTNIEGALKENEKIVADEKKNKKTKPKPGGDGDEPVDNGDDDDGTKSVLSRDTESKFNKGVNSLFDTITPDGENAEFSNLFNDVGTTVKGLFYKAADVGKNTWTTLKSTSGGRTVMGIGGGLLGSWLGMSIFNNFYKGSWVEKLPFVGGLIKTAVWIGMFLGGWKITENMLQSDTNGQNVDPSIVKDSNGPKNKSVALNEMDTKIKELDETVKSTVKAIEDATLELEKQLLNEQINTKDSNKKESLEKQEALEQKIDELKESLKKVKNNSGLQNMKSTYKAAQKLDGDDSKKAELEKEQRKFAQYENNALRVIEAHKAKLDELERASGNKAATNAADGATDSDSSSDSGDDSNGNTQKTTALFKDNKNMDNRTLLTDADALDEDDLDEDIADATYVGEMQTNSGGVPQNVAIVNGQAITLTTGHTSNEIYGVTQGGNGFAPEKVILDKSRYTLEAGGNNHVARNMNDKRADIRFNIEEISHSAEDDQNFAIAERKFTAADIDMVKKSDPNYQPNVYTS